MREIQYETDLRVMLSSTLGSLPVTGVRMPVHQKSHKSRFRKASSTINAIQFFLSEKIARNMAVSKSANTYNRQNWEESVSSAADYELNVGRKRR